MAADTSIPKRLVSEWGNDLATIIDRRLNPGGKNFLNRQKFLKRARENIKQTVKNSVSDKNLKAIGKNEKVKIKSKDLKEPYFQNDPETGNHRRVLSGNKDFVKGDRIKKPPAGKSGTGQAGQDPDYNEDFEFALSREEFLDYLFADLELPDFVKQAITGDAAWKTAREGFTTSGSPANLNVEQTFKNAIGRRLALRRPTNEEVEELEARIAEAEDLGLPGLLALRDELESLKRRQKIVPFIDETDLKYNLWTKKPVPKNKAVMFCLMDVSGSMGQTEKDIAKRFFLLLYLFLERRYDTIDLRFIRHTTIASEVDEHTFFYDTLSGGTTISAGLTLINEIIDEEYASDEWNLYVAQCTDGDNWAEDNELCASILENNLLPKLQYFAYVEVSAYERLAIFESFSAWPTYTQIAERVEKLVCKRIKHQNSVWTVFRELFTKDGVDA